MTLDAATIFEETGQIPDEWPMVATYRRDSFYEDLTCFPMDSSAAERIELAATTDGCWAVHEHLTRCHPGGAWEVEDRSHLLDDAAMTAQVMDPYVRQSLVEHADMVETTDDGWHLSWRLDTDDLGPYLRSSEEARFTVLDKEAFAPIQEAIDEL